MDAAAPLFLRMVDALRAERLDPGEIARQQPANLRLVEVCTATGDLPDALCPVLTNAWFIAGKSPIKTNGLHKTVWIDERTGKAVCGPQAHAKLQIVEQWGSDLLRLFSQSGLPRTVVSDPNCSTAIKAELNKSEKVPIGQNVDYSMSQGSAPVIISPLRGVTYTLRMAQATPISLRAEASANVRQLYWFADDALIGKVAPGESLAWLPTAQRTYLLRALDDQGRTESREVTVELIP